jgi:hypothetical protein
VDDTINWEGESKEHNDRATTIHHQIDETFSCLLVSNRINHIHQLNTTFFSSLTLRGTTETIHFRTQQIVIINQSSVFSVASWHMQRQIIVVLFILSFIFSCNCSTSSLELEHFINNRWQSRGTISLDGNKASFKAAATSSGVKQIQSFALSREGFYSVRVCPSQAKVRLDLCACSHLICFIFTIIYYYLSIKCLESSVRICDLMKSAGVDRVVLNLNDAGEPVALEYSTLERCDAQHDNTQAISSQGNVVFRPTSLRLICVWWFFVQRLRSISRRVWKLRNRNVHG